MKIQLKCTKIQTIHTKRKNKRILGIENVHFPTKNSSNFRNLLNIISKLNSGKERKMK